MAKLKEEKDPMNGYFEDLQKKMRLMNQKLLEEAQERKYLKKLQGEFIRSLEVLEKEKSSKKKIFKSKSIKMQRMLGELQNIGL